MTTLRRNKAMRIATASLLAGALVMPGMATAKDPYPGYTYSSLDRPLAAPNAYTPERMLDGAALGIGSLRNPNDLFVRDNRIYLLDSGNNRILMLSEQYRLLTEIKTFRNGDKDDGFNNPQGLFVTEDNHIYVADTDNKRVVHLDGAGRFLQEIHSPKSEILPANFQFAPAKVGVDRAQRVYTVGRGVVEGLIEFDSDGQFSTFMGAPKVRFDPIDLVWKRLSTKAQRDKMVQFVPTEFNNVDMDDSGFLFVTTQTKSSAPIQRLNPTGLNVLRAVDSAPIGDLNHLFGDESMFADIASGLNGSYSALDMTKGRIFTYDEDGRLLYIFGMNGQQVGNFGTPVAIDYMGDKVLVLDRERANITVFKPTLFGAAVNRAVDYQYKGRMDEAKTEWEKTLKLNANYELAYVGIGKSQLRNGDYSAAMRNFKLGSDRIYYSKAFQMERKRLARLYFAPVMSVAVPLLLLLWLGPKAWRRWLKPRLRKEAFHVDRS